jgi:hypothetical protein
VPDKPIADAPHRRPGIRHNCQRQTYNASQTSRLYPTKAIKQNPATALIFTVDVLDVILCHSYSCVQLLKVAALGLRNHHFWKSANHRSRSLETAIFGSPQIADFGRIKVAIFGDFRIANFGDFKVTIFGDFKVAIFGDFKVADFGDFRSPISEIFGNCYTGYPITLNIDIQVLLSYCSY